MNKAAEIIVGHDDFAAFCKTGADNKTTICNVKECRWVQTSDYSWYFTITANRFLRNMVRATVGTLLLLGRHKITLDEFKDILDNGNRSDAGESMPGNALFLENIEY
jgi:tRNA pseudouridine38-40 synthase